MRRTLAKGSYPVTTYSSLRLKVQKDGSIVIITTYNSYISEIKKNGLSIAKTSVGDIREAITRDPIKLEKRSVRWIITAQQYVRSLNRVLSSGTSVLLKERDRLIISQLKPSTSYIRLNSLIDTMMNTK